MVSGSLLHLLVYQGPSCLLHQKLKQNVTTSGCHFVVLIQKLTGTAWPRSKLGPPRLFIKPAASPPSSPAGKPDVFIPAPHLTSRAGEPSPSPAPGTPWNCISSETTFSFVSACALGRAPRRGGLLSASLLARLALVPVQVEESTRPPGLGAWAAPEKSGARASRERPHLSAAGHGGKEGTG